MSEAERSHEKTKKQLEQLERKQEQTELELSEQQSLVEQLLE